MQHERRRPTPDNLVVSDSLPHRAGDRRPGAHDLGRTSAGVFWWRREGEKDGPNFVPPRFTLEPDGRHVRRLKRNLIARTAVALDCETNKKTGEAAAYRFKRCSGADQQG